MATKTTLDPWAVRIALAAGRDLALPSWERSMTEADNRRLILQVTQSASFGAWELPDGSWSRDVSATIDAWIATAKEGAQ